MARGLIVAHMGCAHRLVEGSQRLHRLIGQSEPCRVSLDLRAIRQLARHRPSQKSRNMQHLVPPVIVCLGHPEKRVCRALPRRERVHHAPLALAESGWIRVGAGSWRAGLRSSAGLQALPVGAILPDQRTRAKGGREASALVPLLNIRVRASARAGARDRHPHARRQLCWLRCVRHRRRNRARCRDSGRHTAILSSITPQR